MKRLRMAVIGVGHLGSIHARVLASLPEVELVGVSDVNFDQANRIAKECRTRAVQNYLSLVKQVDAVTVAVPTIYHHQVASTFLRNGVPVLVEKPIAVTIAEADDLIELAREKRVALQVGHIERFNPAFEALIDRPIRPKFIESERHGPYTGRSTDIGAVLDLMIHDLDLLLALMREPVVSVEALGAPVFGGHEDVVNARLTFQGGCVAHVTASRASQNARRRLRIWAPEGYAGIDFVQKRLTLVQPSEQLRRSGLHPEKMDPVRRAALKDELFTKHLETLELDCNRGDQLTSELSHFVKCVKSGRTPRVPGEAGREALALATRILESVQSHVWDADGQATGTAGFPPPMGYLFDNARRDAA